MLPRGETADDRGVDWPGGILDSILLGIALAECLLALTAGAERELYSHLICPAQRSIGQINLPLLLSEVNGLSSSLIAFALVPQRVALIAHGPLAARLSQTARGAGTAPTGILGVIVLMLSAFGVGALAWVASVLAAAISAGVAL